MADVGLGVAWQLGEDLVESDVHLLRRSLEEATTAGDKEGVSVGREASQLLYRTSRRIPQLGAPGEDPSLVFGRILDVVADVILGVARRVKSSDFEVSNAEGILVLELQMKGGSALQSAHRMMRYNARCW